MSQSGETDIMDAGSKKSSKWLKVMGTIAIIGVVIAVGRIVLRGFMDKSGSDGSHEGI